MTVRASGNWGAWMSDRYCRRHVGLGGAIRRCLSPSVDASCMPSLNNQQENAFVREGFGRITAGSVFLFFFAFTVCVGHWLLLYRVRPRRNKENRTHGNKETLFLVGKGSCIWVGENRLSRQLAPAVPGGCGSVAVVIVFTLTTVPSQCTWD